MRTIGVSDSSRNVIETVDNSSLNPLTSLAFLLFDARVVRATVCSSVHGPPRMYENKMYFYYNECQNDCNDLHSNAASCSSSIDITLLFHKFQWLCG